jgi:hypothetical protein
LGSDSSALVDADERSLRGDMLAHLAFDLLTRWRLARAQLVD